MGGRVTDETAEFLDDLLGDKLDDLQDDARGLVDTVEKLVESKLTEVEEKLDDILGRVEELEPSKPPAAAATQKVGKK